MVSVSRCVVLWRAEERWGSVGKWGSKVGRTSVHALVLPPSVGLGVGRREAEKEEDQQEAHRQPVLTEG